MDTNPINNNLKLTIMSIFSNLYSPFIHDSVASEVYPFTKNEATFNQLVHRIVPKYGLRILSEEHDQFKLLIPGNTFISSSRFEELMSANCYINVKRMKDGNLKITSFEKLISFIDSEKESFDKVIECKLNSFMAYLSQEDHSKIVN